MPAFWNVPVGEWSLQFDHEIGRISVCCNGEAVAWGGYEHFREMITTYNRYSYASGKPNCEACGHEFFDHLEPSSMRLLRGQHFPYDSTNNCAWGGGHEGWCNCEGYKNAALDLDKLAPEMQVSGMNTFVDGVRANLSSKAGAKLSDLIADLKFPITIMGHEYHSVEELMEAEFQFLATTARCLKFLVVLVGGYTIFGVLKFFLALARAFRH